MRRFPTVLGPLLIGPPAERAEPTLIGLGGLPLRQGTSLKMRTLAFAVVLAVTLGSAASAQSNVVYSPDITVELSGTVAADEDVADDDQMGTVGLLDLGTLPGAVDVDGYETDADEHLFSLDTWATLPGPLDVAPADVVSFDGVSYALAFDSLTEGIPAGVNVDAVSMSGSDLVLSFDVTVDLGGGLVVDDEDLVTFDGTDFALLLDGSTEGIDRSLDLDAASVNALGHIFVSFDTDGSVDGGPFDDDTVLRRTPAGWTNVFDASSTHPGFANGDVIALPEPGLAVQMGTSLLSLFLINAVRRWKGSHSMAQREDVR
jgi:hypothetical protein